MARQKRVDVDNDLQSAKKKIEALGFNSYGLKQGAEWMLKPNSAKSPSNLPKIFSMLDVLPKGIYTIYCTNAGSKGAGVNFPISTEKETPTTIGEKIVQISQPHTADIETAQRLGRLESENAYLKKCEADLQEQLKIALNRIAELESMDLSEDDDELSEESKPITLMDTITPIIPTLMDRGLSLMESYFASKNKPQLSESQPPQIDYQKLADIVTTNIINYQNQNGQQDLGSEIE